MAAAGRLAFTAAERVIDRVHRDAAHVRPLTHPAAPARFADRHVLVIDVADLPTVAKHSMLILRISPDGI
jgi:hypothetical protein